MAAVMVFPEAAKCSCQSESPPCPRPLNKAAPRASPDPSFGRVWMAGDSPGNQPSSRSPEGVKSSFLEGRPALPWSTSAVLLHPGMMGGRLSGP